MNPNQTPGGSVPTPPSPDATTPDIPDAAFGFADKKQSRQPVAPIAPAPIMPVTPKTMPAMPAKAMPPAQIPPVPTLAAKPAQASSSAASYTPQSVTHLPQDIADRIAETPMQNSSDVQKQITHGSTSNRLKSLLMFVIFATAVFAAAFLINQFVFESYYVDGTSMTPTLQNNDRLIVSKAERTWDQIQGKPYIPQRGQIVVLDSSIVGLDGQKEQLIKRVIGLPGDHIHIENGVVTITDAKYPEGVDITKELGLTNLQPTFSDTPIDLTVPSGQVYVMGDNRGEGGSYDSRAFGPIDGNKIQGRLWARVLPFDHAQLF